MGKNEQAALDELVDKYYRNVLELRATVLRENPGIDQEEYSKLIWESMIPFSNGMISHMAKRMPEAALQYLALRMRKINNAVLHMVVSSNEDGLSPAKTPSKRSGSPEGAENDEK